MEKIDGIDVSHYQGKIDWKTVAKTGPKFAFAKATEGKSIVDKYFKTNWKGIRDNNISTAGVYHYYHTDVSNEEQLISIKANVFDAVDFNPSKDIFAVDFERNIGGLSQLLAASRLYYFLLSIESEFKIKPILYTSPGMWEEIIGSAYTLFNFEKYLLWIANYGTPTPRIPKPWTDYYIWQFTDTGTYPGIDSRRVDLNRYA